MRVHFYDGDFALTPEHIDLNATFEGNGICVVHHTWSASRLNIRKNCNGGWVLVLTFREGLACA